MRAVQSKVSQRLSQEVFFLLSTTITPERSPPRSFALSDTFLYLCHLVALSSEERELKHIVALCCVENSLPILGSEFFSFHSVGTFATTGYKFTAAARVLSFLAAAVNLLLMRARLRCYLLVSKLTEIPTAKLTVPATGVIVSFFHHRL